MISEQFVELCTVNKRIDESANRWASSSYISHMSFNMKASYAESKVRKNFG